MCYSAIVEQGYRAYLRMTGAEMDFDQFIDIFGTPLEKGAIRIPRGLERNFDHPAGEKERRIKRLIDAYHAAEITRLGLLTSVRFALLLYQIARYFSKSASAISRLLLRHCSPGRSSGR